MTEPPILAHPVEEEIIFGLENLGLPRETVAGRLEATLARFGLKAMRDRSPQTLSGGEQQKLALAAVIARQPPILVLDEPLSMLDGTAAADLVTHLADLADGGTTVVAYEHRQEYLQAIPGLRTLCLEGPAPEEIDVPVLHKRAAAAADRLEVEGLTVWLGGQPILRDLHCSMESGQVVAVVGRSGPAFSAIWRKNDNAYFVVMEATAGKVGDQFVTHGLFVGCGGILPRRCCLACRRRGPRWRCCPFEPCWGEKR